MTFCFILNTAKIPKLSPFPKIKQILPPKKKNLSPKMSPPEYKPMGLILVIEFLHVKKEITIPIVAPYCRACFGFYVVKEYLDTCNVCLTTIWTCFGFHIAMFKDF